jgi:diguanylate cyclase (GGDEF)-like protein
MDPLAELPGADHFELLLAREELRRARTGEALAVSILDLDGMRAVNAEHGAAAGTELLRRCAECLVRTLRAVDDIARTGPDEFSVLLHATNAKGAGCWASRFEDSLEAAAREHPAAPITCSLGIADSTEEPTLMEVAARARRRMEVIRNVRRQRRARESET